MAPELIQVTHQMVEIVSAQPDKPNSTMTIPSTAYRLHFSCDYRGKYRASSKRRIIWRFGFTNLTSLREGRDGRDCRGEEHEIELLWSVKSGKTRLLWNKINISHFFREEQLFEEVNLSWEARSGERFQIIASSKRHEDRPQYDLLIDGVSFFKLPRPSQLRAVKPYDVASDLSISTMDEEDLTEMSTSEDFVQEAGEDGSPEVRDLRLAMAKLAPSVDKSESSTSLDDDLSVFFTNNLESLRHRVTLMIPGIEDLVSRAIVNAFSEERDSRSSGSSSTFDSLHPSPIYIEAGAIWDSISWMELNFDYAPRPDIEDRKRMFFQKQLDCMFVHVRQEHLTECAAVRILCNVATILRMELKIPVRMDTLLLHGVHMHVSQEDAVSSLQMFGEIVDAAMSKGRRFGIVRFSHEESVAKVLSASATGMFSINAIASTITRVEYQEHIRRQPPQPSVVERAQSDPIQNFRTHLQRKRSHQRNTITIDSVLSAAPFLMVEPPPAPLVSPDSSKSILQPGTFSCIPAKTTPPVFDSPAVPHSF